ncbi:hypothetical protein JCGZ_06401 [Jatropha curcas]|uniref:Uncharacterized protein n=1 Tax=Jatropha curcas TaxID=180498 RepID=A0A067KNP3_JATCU|nr:hypothetical protein JCGZ_06401 [Jatropha curcas]
MRFWMSESDAIWIAGEVGEVGEASEVGDSTIGVTGTWIGTRIVGAVLGDVPFPPGMEVALDPTLGLGPAIVIPADLRQAPPQLQLDPEHATHDLEIGRLRRHQSRQSGVIARLQMEVDRLRTRLEGEGGPLDFSEEEDDDDDGSSSDDAPTPPPSSVGQAAAGPSRRRC